MTKHEHKPCPRCQKIFECKVGNINECQCNEIRLNEEVQNYIAKLNYEDCLCINCLKELQAKWLIKK